MKRLVFGQRKRLLSATGRREREEERREGGRGEEGREGGRGEEGREGREEREKGGGGSICTLKWYAIF